MESEEEIFRRWCEINRLDTTEVEMKNTIDFQAFITGWRIREACEPLARACGVFLNDFMDAVARVGRVIAGNLRELHLDRYFITEATHPRKKKRGTKRRKRQGRL